MSSIESYDRSSHRVHSAYEPRPLPNSPQSDDLLSREPPSNEVLEFYRRKVAILAADSEYFQKQLNDISDIIVHQHSLRLQLQEKEDAIMDLKYQISKLEVIFQLLGSSHESSIWRSVNRYHSFTTSVYLEH